MTQGRNAGRIHIETRVVHPSIMVEQVLECLSPRPGETAVDCTLGAGGHARAILRRITPGGRLIGLDVDPIELPRTERRLRDEGFGPDVFTARTANFASLREVLAELGATADLVVADLGVSAMQTDDPARGLSFKGAGPFDMRMDPTRGQPASSWLASVSEGELAAILTTNADEPHAALIASLLKRQPLSTTQAVERTVRTGLNAAHPDLPKAAVKMSVRRTFQAIRIAVNGEFGALDALLEALPSCLAPGGRAAIITFHSGEDRRVKHAFRSGHRDGVYAAVATSVIRSTKEETFANRRAAAAKLRWAVRAPAASAPA